MRISRSTVATGFVLTMVLTTSPALAQTATPTAAARTTTVSCGQVVTTSIKLAADVGPCPADGIVVAADGVTVDLNGHRVFGMAAPEAKGDYAGIRLRRTTGATVKGGEVDHFAAGVVVQRGSANTVQGVFVHDNITVCPLREVHTQLLGLLGDGITLLSSRDSRVVGNRALHNGPFSGISVVGETSAASGKLIGPAPTGNTVIGNVVDDNSTCRPDMGIRLEGPGAAHNTVAFNRVEHSTSEGIVVLPVLRRDISGFGTTCGDPIAFPKLPLCPLLSPPNPANSDNLISGNTSVANAVGRALAGISLLAFPDTINPERNTVRDNRVERNGGSGIAIIGGDTGDGRPPFGSTHNRIIGNLAFDNNRDRCTEQTCGSLRYDLIDGNQGRPCDHDVWSGNAYGTAFPACTTAGGTPLPPGPVAPQPGPAATSPGAGLRTTVSFLPRFVT